MDPRGFPTSLPEFQAVFPTEEACAAYLEKLRWPDGFVCPSCGVAGEAWRFKDRVTRFRCHACRKDEHLTAGTVMKNTHVDLSVWFWAAFLVTTHTPGHSALQFQRSLGLSRYETAFQILHKLRSGMVNPDRSSIGVGERVDHVEVDEVLIGGRTKGEGRGKHHKTLVVGAVEVKAKKPDESRVGKPVRHPTYMGRLRLTIAAARTTKLIEGFVTDNVSKGASVRTDGLARYDGLRDLGYRHDPIIVRGDQTLTEAHLNAIHTVFGNLKVWLLGTHHGVSQTHLQAYLNEFVFRFNRRFYPMTTFNSILGLAAHKIPPTYEALYSGEWQHPTG
ncbi:MAG: IS1595 family transposase [Polyangiales bacterium]